MNEAQNNYENCLVFLDKFKLSNYLLSCFTDNRYCATSYNWGACYGFGLDNNGNIIPGTGRYSGVGVNFILKDGLFYVRKKYNKSEFNKKQSIMYWIVSKILDKADR